MMNDHLPARRRFPMRTVVVAVLPALLLVAGLSWFGVAPGCSATSASAAHPAAVAASPDGDSAFVPAERDGMKGGRLVYDLPGSVDDVLAMLLDFDHAEGHRSWASEYRVVEREGERVLAEWRFRGRLGIRPRVQIQFSVFRDGPTASVNFALQKNAFGMSRFSGNHTLTPLPGDSPRVRMESTVFIDSGISLANASHEDVEKGLRADALLMSAWMEERLAQARDPVTER